MKRGRPKSQNIGTWKLLEFQDAEFNYDDIVRIKKGASDIMKNMGLSTIIEYEGLIGKVKSFDSQNKAYHIDSDRGYFYILEQCLEKYDEQREQMNELENTL